MAIDTVTLTADAVWQDGTPFQGYLEVTLQQTEAASGGLVAPKRQQEIVFEEGQAVITLVPSSALNGAKYRIRVVTTAVAGNYKSKTVLLDELVEIPDADCSLHEIVAAQTKTDGEEGEATGDSAEPSEGGE